MILGIRCYGGFKAEGERHLHQQQKVIVWSSKGWEWWWNGVVILCEAVVAHSPFAPQSRESGAHCANLVAYRLPSILGKNQMRGIKSRAFATIYQIQFFHPRGLKTHNLPMMTKYQ